MRDPNDTRTIDMGMPTQVGYGRVSKGDEQNLDLQEDALKAAGCVRIFTDEISRTTTDRPGLNAALEFLRAGDVLVVWKLDRLGGSLRHLVRLVDELRERGVGFRSITEPFIDTTTAHGELIFGFFAVLAQYEVSRVRERTRAGLAAAQARGRKGGRRPVVTPEKLNRARQLIEGKGLTVREAAGRVKVGKTALYAALRAEGEGGGGNGS